MGDPHAPTGLAVAHPPTAATDAPGDGLPRYSYAFQPIVDTIGRRVYSYEALIRDPATALTYALSSFGDTKPDPARLRAAISGVDGEDVAQRRITPRPGSGVHAPRDVTQFRHYDAHLFRHLDKLHLTRQEVNRLFRRNLGRDAAEANMLALQTSPSLDALERMILGSPEYTARGRRLRAV